jgi:hypothetical protein
VKDRLLLIFIAAATAAAVAGCSGPEVPDVDLSLPPPSESYPFPPASERPVPPATHKWKTDGLVCPQLTDPVASALGISGPGKVTDSTDLKRLGNSIECRWGPGNETATTFTLNISTSTSQAGADAGWKVASGYLPKPLPGVGEQAFISDEIGDHQIRVAVRSGNATLQIKLLPKKGDAKAEKALRDNAAAIGTNMLSSLVPA